MRETDRAHEYTADCTQAYEIDLTVQAFDDFLELCILELACTAHRHLILPRLYQHTERHFLEVVVVFSDRVRHHSICKG